MTRFHWSLSKLTLLSIATILLLMTPAHSQIVRETITPEVMEALLNIADRHFFIDGAKYRISCRKLLRAAFHDCMGGCDGSLNLNNSENRGLQLMVYQLNRSYQASADSINIKKYLSRADWWVLAELRALGWGFRNGSSYPAFTNSTPIFKYGRTSAPTPNLDNYESPFPDPRTSWDTIMPKMYAGLPGVSEKDIVALLGLHGSGLMVMNNSGFSGPWGIGADLNGVNNHFFYNMYGINSRANFTQVTSDKVTLTGSTEPTYYSPAPEWNKIEWTNGGNNKGDGRVFLNVDLQIYLNFTVDSTGRTSSLYYPQTSQYSLSTPPGPNYPPLARNAGLGFLYANDKETYLQDLISAFKRLNNVLNPETNPNNIKSFYPQVICDPFTRMTKCFGDFLFTGCGIVPMPC